MEKGFKNGLKFDLEYLKKEYDKILKRIDYYEIVIFECQKLHQECPLDSENLTEILKNLKNTKLEIENEIHKIQQNLTED